MNPAAPATIDAYIATFPKEVQTVLAKIRALVLKAAPGAEEMISYQYPAFKWKGQYLIYFAGFKTHAGMYPVHAKDIKDARFAKELAPYTSGKATAKFSLEKPLPATLIAKIVKHKIKQAEDRAVAKAAKTTVKKSRMSQKSRSKSVMAPAKKTAKKKKA